LLLWIDDVIVTFNAPTTYDELNNTQPDASDLSPAGVASVGARVRVSHLRISRDLYYIATNNSVRQNTDYEEPLSLSQNLTKQLIQNRPKKRSADFQLKSDQFFMLGDNSTCSLDGRLWDNEHWVRRELLIGKALVVYWPHSWDAIRTPWGNVPFPYFPNVERMGLVR
jgi:signal peptidase I